MVGAAVHLDVLFGGQIWLVHIIGYMDLLAFLYGGVEDVRWG